MNNQQIKVCILNHDFLTLRRFEWISLRNGDFKFEKTIFKWRVRWTFQRPFKFINVGLIFAPKWLSRIGTLKKDFLFLTFWKILDVNYHLTFSILLSSVFKRATRAIFVFSLNYSLEVFDTISARFVLKILSKILFFVYSIS